MADQSARAIRGIHQRGPRAAQPAAREVLEGTLYFSTDPGDPMPLERSNGTVWESYGPPVGPGPPPVPDPPVLPGPPGGGGGQGH